jgi:hypothetical protein
MMNSELAVKNFFCERLGEGKINYNRLMAELPMVCAVISEALNISLPNAYRADPFYQEFVESKNLLEGDSNEFVIPDNSKLIVSRFSGNHWNTDREPIRGKQSFTVPTQWFAIHVYEELDRVLRGISTVQEMFKKINDSLIEFINERIYASFSSSGTYLGDDFKAVGSFDRNSMLQLADRVRTATRKEVKILGTRQGLSLISDSTATQWVSNSMADERNRTGVTGYWEGIPTVVLPQVFLPGSYDFAINPYRLLIIPIDKNGYKPVKLFFEGENRIRNQDQYTNEDQTIDIQIQTKLGVGFVMSDLYGEYIIDDMQ